MHTIILTLTDDSAKPLSMGYHYLREIDAYSVTIIAGNDHIALTLSPHNFELFVQGCEQIIEAEG